MKLIQFCAIIFVFVVTAAESTELLYYYQTKHITKETFIGQETKDVHYLDFRGCSVETISNTAFDDMPKLTHLMLLDNMIETLPHGVFNKLKNVNTIILEANKLKHIPGKVFSNLNQLHVIDLSYNAISSVAIGAFDNDPELKSIHLKYNRLTVIPVGVFNKLKELTDLDLSNNRLYNIEESALPNFQKLTTLLIHGNKFQHFNKKHVELLTKSILDKNPWFCDCKLKEVHAKWQTTFQSQGWTPICNAPKNVQNFKWDKLTSDDFVCPQVYLHIYPELFEISAETGQSISLNCYVTGGVKVSEVKWIYKNNKDVNDVLKDADRSFNVQIGTVRKNKLTIGVWYNITINEIISSDDGIYKCVVNQNNKIYEVEKKVLVLE